MNAGRKATSQAWTLARAKAAVEADKSALTPTQEASRQRLEDLKAEMTAVLVRLEAARAQLPKQSRLETWMLRHPLITACIVGTAAAAAALPIIALLEAVFIGR